MLGLTATLITGLALGATVELLHADRVEMRGKEGSRVTSWIGGVDVIRGEERYRADRAEWHQATEELVLMGNVICEQSGNRIQSDTLVHQARDGRTLAHGNGLWISDGLSIWGDRLVREGVPSVLSAAGSPRLEATRAWLEGRQGEGGDDRPPVQVNADLLWTPEDERDGDAHAVGMVEIDMGTVQATGDTARFDRKGGRLILRGTPRATRDQGVLHGDELRVHIVEGQVSALESIGSARFEDSSDPTKVETIEGDSLYLVIKDGAAQTLDVHGNASAIHYPEGGPARADEINELGGQWIHAVFVDEKVERVRAERVSRGIYRFKNDRRGN